MTWLNKIFVSIGLFLISIFGGTTGSQNPIQPNTLPVPTTDTTQAQFPSSTSAIQNQPIEGAATATQQASVTSTQTKPLTYHDTATDFGNGMIFVGSDLGVLGNDDINNVDNLANITVTDTLSEDVFLKILRFNVQNIAPDGTRSNVLLNNIIVTINGNTYPAKLAAMSSSTSLYEVGLNGGETFTQDLGGTIRINADISSLPSGTLALWIIPADINLVGASTGNSISPIVYGEENQKNIPIYWRGLIHLKYQNPQGQLNGIPVSIPTTPDYMRESLNLALVPAPYTPKTSWSTMELYDNRSDIGNPNEVYESSLTAAAPAGAYDWIAYLDNVPSGVYTIAIYNGDNQGALLATSSIVVSPTSSI